MKLVPFETAKKLADKGFDKPTLLSYNDNGIIPEVLPDAFTMSKNTFYRAPSISQVLKWLREEKKIHLMIDIWKIDLNDATYKWGYDIVNLTTTHVEGYDTHCANSFEQAAVIGIEYILDNLI